VWGKAGRSRYCCLEEGADLIEVEGYALCREGGGWPSASGRGVEQGEVYNSGGIEDIGPIVRVYESGRGKMKS